MVVVVVVGGGGGVTPASFDKALKVGNQIVHL